MSQARNRVVVPFEEAVARLPDGERIFVAVNPFFHEANATWRRDAVVEAMRGREVMETGWPTAANGYGLAYENDYGWYFIGTNRPAVGRKP